MLRSWSEPSSQKAISSAANGLGARLRTSAVPAPARLDKASPARMRTRRLDRGPATRIKSATEMNAPRIAAKGKRKEMAPTEPKAITATAPNAAAAEAPNRSGAASGLRNRPCIAAPAKPSEPPMRTARIARGSRISTTIIRAASVPRPTRVSRITSGGRKTAPAPSDRTKRIATRRPSATSSTVWRSPPPSGISCSRAIAARPAPLATSATTYGTSAGFSRPAEFGDNGRENGPTTTVKQRQQDKRVLSFRLVLSGLRWRFCRSIPLRPPRRRGSCRSTFAPTSCSSRLPIPARSRHCRHTRLRAR